MTDSRRALVAKKLRNDFDKFVQMAIEDGDGEFIRYLYSLIFRVYEMDQQGRYMTKMQACRYIPLSHAATCKKYLEIAERKGFFKEFASEIDKRKKLIKPGPALISFVEKEIEETLEEIEQITSENSQIETFSHIENV